MRKLVCSTHKPTATQTTTITLTPGGANATARAETRETPAAAIATPPPPIPTIERVITTSGETDYALRPIDREASAVARTLTAAMVAGHRGKISSSRSSTGAASGRAGATVIERSGTARRVRAAVMMMDRLVKVSFVWFGLIELDSVSIAVIRCDCVSPLHQTDPLYWSITGVLLEYYGTSWCDEEYRGWKNPTWFQLDWVSIVWLIVLLIAWWIGWLSIHLQRDGPPLIADPARDQMKYRYVEKPFGITYIMLC